jgi:enediyne biosynthesis protein E4
VIWTRRNFLGCLGFALCQTGRPIGAFFERVSGLFPPQKLSSPSPDNEAFIEFEDTIRRSGIDFSLLNSVSSHRYSIETMMGGVAALDYNNDGWLDLFFSNGAPIPSLEKTDPKYYNRLYRNNGDGTFTDVTVKAGVQGKGYCMGVAAGDYDNDGFVDLYVCGVNHNQLLHNNGDGTFTDVTAKAGVGGIHPKFGKTWSVTAGWFDYNNDGLLDLFVCNYLKYDLATAAPCVLQGYPAYCSPNEFHGLPNMLYRNNGDGTFTDVTEQSGLNKHLGKGMGIAFADYDNDGFVDVFVSNDSFRNFLFHNNGNGTFSEVARDLGVAYNENGGTVAGMGTDFRDLNDDGRPDIFHTAMFADTFPLYRNTGKGFEDATVSSRLAAQTRTLTGWGTGAYDFDNDGRKDLFTANAEILDNSLEIGHRPFPMSNSVFRNMGNLQFLDVSGQAGSSFLTPMAHRGAAFGDFDNDGRVDIAVTVLNGAPQILMNRSKNKHHWLIIRLVGKKDNRDGLGAKIAVTTSGGVQYNHASTAVGYNSSSDKRVHFGLGDAAVADRIEVHWPNGHRQILRDVRGDQILTITQDEESPSPK